jgi:hypothetical protein
VSQRATKKVEEIQNSELTAENEALLCTPRSEKRDGSKEPVVLQIKGLQIELNLVPTMK